MSMSTRPCAHCGGDIHYLARSDARYCATRCRVAARRARFRQSFPPVMAERHSWVRADGKRPIQPSGRPASTTDPTTWATFAEVQSGAGDGFGIMLGDGLGCYDFDDADLADVARFVRERVGEPVLFAERSMSGRGVHVFVQADPQSGWRRVIDGLSVEYYSRARFIRTTGSRLDPL